MLGASRGVAVVVFARVVVFTRQLWLSASHADDADPELTSAPARGQAAPGTLPDFRRTALKALLAVWHGALREPRTEGSVDVQGLAREMGVLAGEAAAGGEQGERVSGGLDCLAGLLEARGLGEEWRTRAPSCAALSAPRPTLSPPSLSPLLVSAPCLRSLPPLLVSAPCLDLDLDRDVPAESRGLRVSFVARCPWLVPRLWCGQCSATRGTEAEIRGAQDRAEAGAGAGIGGGRGGGRRGRGRGGRP